MIRGTIFTGLLLLLFQVGLAQKGGESTYSFLGLSNAARVAALGGEVVSLMDDDINMVFHNPALLTSGMHNNLNLNYVNYFAGVNYGYASYGYAAEGIGNFAAGMHYVNYGTFDRTDELGQSQGTFRASEYALNLIYSRSFLDTLLTAGVNLKPIFSSLEQYTSLGIALDIGVTYYHPRTLTTVGLVVKNMGTQITSYTGRRESLPFEIQAGVTQGLAHAPFRFTVTLQHLERWDLTYTVPDDNETPFPGNDTEQSGFDMFGDKLMRH
ncbi:MAG: type IX secretion system protein PorQ, partial [Bacteroidales bacterium]|nr:type IX secretion system protein PorQ [Bacteroidales bacterium]